MRELTLTGLDGANPLAFFAALGVLEACDGPERCRLRWAYNGGWRPVLISPYGTVEALVERLDEDRRCCVADPSLALTYGGKQDLKPPPPLFRNYLEALTDEATSSLRRSIDWAAAFATDVSVDNNGNTKPTALHFTAGNQQFLKMALELVNEVTLEDFHEVVAGPWSYNRLLPVMRWDSTSARDYALRATDPSDRKWKERGVPGADWLALRGLTYLPAMPRGTRVYTTGCVGGWKDGRFRWPLWISALPSPVIRSLMSQTTEEFSSDERKARGIGAVFSSGIKRSDQGGYGSFQPATPV